MVMASRFGDSGKKSVPGPQAVNSTTAKRRNQANRYDNMGIAHGHETESQGSPDSPEKFASRSLIQLYGKNNSKGPSWEGKCIHIVIELAECGDVQQLVERQL